MLGFYPALLLVLLSVSCVVHGQEEGNFTENEEENVKRVNPETHGLDHGGHGAMAQGGSFQLPLSPPKNVRKLPSQPKVEPMDQEDSDVPEKQAENSETVLEYETSTEERGNETERESEEVFTPDPLDTRKVTASPPKQSDGCKLFCFYTPPRHSPLSVKELPSRNPCTHLIYGFASVSPDHLILPSNPNDLSTPSSPGNYANINRLKMTSPHLKTLLGIEPSAHGRISSPRGDLKNLKPRMDFMLNPYTRTTFSRSSLRLLRRNGFDGLILRIKEPQRYRREYLKTLQNLRNAFYDDATLKGRNELILAIMIGSDQLEACKSFLGDASKLVDFVYVATYETKLAGDSHKTSHVNPIHSSIGTPPTETISWARNATMSAGVDGRKVILGLSLWSRSYTLQDKQMNGVGAPVHSFGPGGNPGNSKPLNLPAVCHRQKARYTEVRADRDANANYMVDVEHGEWISAIFPDSTFNDKLEFVKSAGVAGVGLWSLDADDFKDKECNSGAYPFLKRAADRMKCVPMRFHPGYPNYDIESVYERKKEKTKRRRCLRLCYYNPSRDKSMINLPDFHPQWCTHLIAQNLEPTPDGLHLHAQSGVAAFTGFYKEWRGISDKPLLLFAIGGMQYKKFSTLITDHDRRSSLVNSIVQYLTETGAQGVDLQISELIRTEDERDGFNELVKELKSAFVREASHRVLIVSIFPEVVYSGHYYVNQLAAFADYVNLVGDQFHEANSTVTGHHSPLFGPEAHWPLKPRMALHSLTRHLFLLGMPKSKMVGGITSIAQSQTLKTPLARAGAHLLLKAVGPGKALESGVPGKANYPEIEELIRNAKSGIAWLKEMAAPVMVHGYQFYSFDDINSAYLKTAWAHINELAGVSVNGIEWNKKKDMDLSFPFLRKILQFHRCLRCDNLPIHKDDPKGCKPAYTMAHRYGMDIGAPPRKMRGA